MNPPPSTVVDTAAWADLADLDEKGENLTRWEIDFVESLTRWLKMGKWLSSEQSSKLHDIMANRIP